MDLSACIEGSSLFARVSELQLNSYEGVTGNVDVVYRFCLSNTYYTNTGKITETNKDFETSGAEVNMMIRLRRSTDDWVRQMDDLIRGKTDRAFLKYRAKLNDLGDWDDDYED